MIGAGPGPPTRTLWALLTAILILAAPPRPGPAAAQEHEARSSQGTRQFGGLHRTYHLYVPAGLDGNRPVPLVIVLHGGGGTGAGMEQLTRGGLNRLADRDGFIVAYPDGLDRHWNDGRGIQAYRAHREDVDDVGFITALVEHIGRTVPLDRGRVYAAGISNGGLMSFRLAREATTRIAAIAPVAIAMSEQIARMRAPQRPVPVVLIAGTDDPLVPWGGGEIGFAGRQKVGRVLSVAETVRHWVVHNQCPPSPAVATEPDRDPHDGTRVRREAYSPCRDGSEVVLYAVLGGGHTWPGGAQYLPARVIGRTSRDIDANTVIWEFFKRHAMR